MITGLIKLPVHEYVTIPPLFLWRVSTHGQYPDINQHQYSYVGYFFHSTPSVNETKKAKMAQLKINNSFQGTKIFRYCTCPAGRVTYNIHSSCKHMYLPFKSLYNKNHMGVIWLIKFLISLLIWYLPSQIHNCIPYTDKRLYSQYSEKASFTIRF